jgi:GT2 family glycosyltransferase
MPRVSINIPTWRRRPLLERLLTALTTQDELPHSDIELLVCDSGSGDGTKEMMAAFAANHPNVRFLDIATNTASAKRNALATASRAPLLIYLDDDCIPAPGFLTAHLALHDRRDAVVGCGAIRYPIPWVEESNYFRFRDSRHMGPARPDIDPERVPGKNWTTMNMSMKARDVARWGLMDESFVRYGGEDQEFAERWERNGATGVFVPNALVWHHEWGGSVEQFERKQYFTSCYGMARLIELYPDYAQKSALRFLEPAGRNATAAARLIDVAVRLATNGLCTAAVRMWLTTTDHFRPAYAPGLYRYIAASAYARGARDRVDAPSGSWF